jgi:orotidine-5'-phosphate decarboxylase
MTGVLDSVPDQVRRLGALALLSGCHGIIASAQEAPALRKELGTHFIIVTPGVRPAGTAHGDQARVVTPAEAMKAGVNYIVVGRPITAASDPAAAARDIVTEMRGKVHA